MLLAASCFISEIQGVKSEIQNFRDDLAQFLENPYLVGDIRCHPATGEKPYKSHLLKIIAVLLCNQTDNTSCQISEICPRQSYEHKPFISAQHSVYQIIDTMQGPLVSLW